MNGEGTQAERKVQRYRTQKERSGKHINLHKTLRAEMERSRNAGRNADGTQLWERNPKQLKTDNYKKNKFPHVEPLN